MKPNVFGGLPPYVVVITAFLSFGSATTSDKFVVTARAKLESTDIFENISKVSRVECSTRCSLKREECQSLNYLPATGQCELSSVPAVQLPISKVAAIGWNVAGKINVWTLVFRGTPSIGDDVYAAWTLGTNTTPDDANCKTLSSSPQCSHHFRDPMVSSWSALSISKVKYSMYRDGEEVAYVTFNAIGSDISNWFSKDRILQSSWLDISDLETFQFFSIEGDASRRFYISPTYDGCTGDTGYTVAIATSSEHLNCAMDAGPFPQFLYANSSSYVVTNDLMKFPRADVMAIHVMA